MRKKYKLGCSIALTGVEEIHGKYELEAVKMAVDEAIKKGLPFDLELVYFDDGANFKMSEEVATKLCQDPEIMGVLGCQGSNATLGGAPIYFKNGMAAMTFTGSNATASEKGYNTFFRIIANDNVHSKEFVKFASEYLKVKSVSLVCDETAFGRGLMEIIEKDFEKAGIKVLSKVEISEFNKDVSKQVEETYNAKAELIFYVGMEPEGNHIALELRKRGVMTPLLGTDAVKPSKYLTTPGYNVEGPYQSNVCIDITKEPIGFNFAKRYLEYANTDYTVYTLEAFDGAKAIIDAMAACGEDVTREKVVENLHNMTFDLEMGKVKFDAKGEIETPHISWYTFENQDTIKALGTLDELLKK